MHAEAFVRRQHVEAVHARLAGAAEVMWAGSEQVRPVAYRELYQDTVEAIRTALGAEAFAAAWSAGRAMSREQAIAEALSPEFADTGSETGPGIVTSPHT